MNIRVALIALSVSAWLLGPVPAAAQPETGPPPLVSPPLDNARCDGPSDGEVRTYLSINNAFGDTRADGTGRIRLRGWLHVPPGRAPHGGFPVIIFNHGSNKSQTSDNRCVLADYFAALHDYILFVPIRRGHDGSTGEYYDDYSSRRADETCAMVECSEVERRWWKRYFTMNYLEEQREDVVAAIRYVQDHVRAANPERIAVMGQSFGGMVTLLFNELPNFNSDGVAGNALNVRAAVAISAGAQSWSDENSPSDYLQQRLRTAVREAKRPIYFLQPKNDKSMLPTIELSYEAGHAGHRYQATMFGAVPDSLIQPCIPESEAEEGESTCRDAAHGKFVREESQVRIWGPAVVEFFRRMGVTRQVRGEP